MEVSGQLHAPAALPPGKEPLVSDIFLSLFVSVLCFIVSVSLFILRKTRAKSESEISQRGNKEPVTSLFSFDREIAFLYALSYQFLYPLYVSRVTQLGDLISCGIGSHLFTLVRACSWMAVSVGGWENVSRCCNFLSKHEKVRRGVNGRDKFQYLARR
jgi:hypothetical protein